MNNACNYEKKYHNAKSPNDPVIYHLYSVSFSFLG